MSNFGERLKQLRGTQSQAVFAKLFGIPQMTLSNYETGKSEPKFGLILCICIHFSISSDWLLFGRGPMRADVSTNGSPAVNAVRNHEPSASLSTDKNPLHAPLPTPQPPLASQAEYCSPCPRCPKLDTRLEEMEGERRELTTEIRQLWRENAALREENATLRERQYQKTDRSHGEAVGAIGA